VNGLAPPKQKGSEGLQNSDGAKPKQSSERRFLVLKREKVTDGDADKWTGVRTCGQKRGFEKHPRTRRQGPLPQRIVESSAVVCRPVAIATAEQVSVELPLRFAMRTSRSTRKTERQRRLAGRTLHDGKTARMRAERFL
jgi:hypothetical protein